MKVVKRFLELFPIVDIIILGLCIYERNFLAALGWFLVLIMSADRQICKEYEKDLEKERDEWRRKFVNEKYFKLNPDV